MTALFNDEKPEMIASIELVRRYGGILELNEFKTGGTRHQSSLPCSVELLKSAIVDVAVSDEDDEDTKTLLKEGFVFLAEFSFGDLPDGVLYGLAGSKTVTEIQQLHCAMDAAELSQALQNEQAVAEKVSEEMKLLEVEWEQRLAIARRARHA